MSAKIDTNSNMTFESKMNLKSISVCSKSIKITAILISFFRWLKYSWNWYNYLSFSVRKSSINHTKAEVSMEITFQTCGLFCFDFFLWIHTFMCSFYTIFCVIFSHNFLCCFAKGQLSFLKIIVCYLCFPFFVNQLHIFKCKNYQFMYLISE